MNRKNCWNSFLSAALCFALLTPFLNVVVKAQDGNAKLIARLQNRSKLQLDGKKFESAVAKLRPLAAKNSFTEQDLAQVDAFIAETDDGEQIAVRAQSKAFAAAQSVKAFEDGVKAASKGKNPKAFIESLEDSPQSVNQIAGAREASQAFTNSVKADAAVLKSVGERMKAQGKKQISQSDFNQNPQVQFVKASFAAKEEKVRQDIKALVSDASFEPAIHGAALMAQTGVLEVALIALAAAYLGVQTARLTNGAIGACIDRAMTGYNRCIRTERRDGSGLTLAERLFCRGEFLIDAYICVILPI